MIRKMIFAIATGAAIGTAAVIPILDLEAEALPPRYELQRESFPQLGSQTARPTLGGRVQKQIIAAFAILGKPVLTTRELLGWSHHLSLLGEQNLSATSVPAGTVDWEGSSGAAAAAAGVHQRARRLVTCLLTSLSKHRN